MFRFAFIFCRVGLNGKYFCVIMITNSLLLLLQSLMTGLMYNRPEDHITYLQDCLKTLESEKGDEPVAWNRFIAASKALPPIPSEQKNGFNSPSSETGFSAHVASDSTPASGAYFSLLSTEILL